MLCDYGCGRIGIYKFSNGKICCHKNVAKCPFIKEKRKISHKKFFEKENEKDKYNRIKKLKEAWTNEKKEKAKEKSKEQWLCDGHKELHSKIKKEFYKIEAEESRNERFKKIQRSLKKRSKDISSRVKLSIEQIKERYPFFSKIEEVRYNPKKALEEKEIQVHCKNHNCPNSKEQGGWFTPTRSQLYERIRQLEKDYGNEGGHFYCSDKCKYNCPLWNIKKDPLDNKINCYTDEEYQTFRKFVLERDNYECQYCGKPAEHVHHEKPQSKEPFFSLDPDYSWSVCKKCHFKYGHKDECSIGNLIRRNYGQ